MIIKQCLSCPKKVISKRQKFCSISCSTSYYNKRKVGKDSHRWMGNKVGYHGIHKWINNLLGKAKKCSNKKCLGRSNIFEWCNISGKYRRHISDWKQLCRSCHRKLDETPEKIMVFKQRMKGRIPWNKGSGHTSNCQTCHKVFKSHPSFNSKYCSRKCYIGHYHRGLN